MIPESESRAMDPVVSPAANSRSSGADGPAAVSPLPCDPEPDHREARRNDQTLGCDSHWACWSWVIIAVGLLGAIAIPSFSGARQAAREKACYANLRVLATALEQFNLDHPKTPLGFDGSVVPQDILVAKGYLIGRTRCPLDQAGGDYYTQESPLASAGPRPGLDEETPADGASTGIATTGIVVCPAHGGVD